MKARRPLLNSRTLFPLPQGPHHEIEASPDRRLCRSLGLTACGGGSDGSNAGTTVSSPPTLTMNDTTVGTGAVAGDRHHRRRSSTPAGCTAPPRPISRARQFDSGTINAPARLRTSRWTRHHRLIPGFEQGVVGMKVGGKRTLLIPSSLGYGAPAPARHPAEFRPGVRDRTDRRHKTCRTPSSSCGDPICRSSESKWGPRFARTTSVSICVSRAGRGPSCAPGCCRGR